MPSKAELAEAVKDLQRGSSEAKEAWGNYCTQWLQGVRNPYSHDATTLQDFLTAYEQGQVEGSGAAVEVEEVEEGDEGEATLVERFKARQRSDDAFKQAWAAHCVKHLGGYKDPSLHESSVVQAFITSYDEGTLDVAPDARADTESASWAELVKKIKQMQRTDPAGKKAWIAYCEEHLGGKRDPGVHDEEVLRGFLEARAEGGFEEDCSESSKVELVERIKKLQRTDDAAKQAWGDYCGGVRDPSRHDAEFLQAFLGSLGGSPSAGRRARAKAAAPAGKGKACEEFIRHGQWLSAAFKQAWSTYCSAYGAEHANPAAQQAFVAEFAEYAGQLLLGDLEQQGAAPDGDAEAGQKRQAEAPAAGEPPKAKARLEGTATAARKVSLKRSVVAEVRRLNSSGSLLAEIQLSRVAGPLSQLDEAAALGALVGLEAAGAVEDPSAFICQAAEALLTGPEA